MMEFRVEGAWWTVVAVKSLLHFTWEALAMLAVAWGARAGLRHSTAARRYGVLLGLFGVMAALPLINAAVIVTTRQESLAVAALPAEAKAKANVGGENPVARKPAARFWTGMAGAESGLPAGTLLKIYGAGVLLMLGKLAWSVAGGRTLRKTSLAVDDPRVLSEVGRRAVRLGLAATPAVAYCARITVPCIVGVIRPMLLLPGGFEEVLDDRKVRWMIAHELAHIGRNDHLVNFLQRVVESGLFFHPAMWKLSNMVRHERECCCDDVATDGPAERLAYGRLLLELASGLKQRRALTTGAVDGRSSAWHRVARLAGVGGTEPFQFYGRRIAITVLLTASTMAAASMAIPGYRSPARAAEAADRRSVDDADVQGLSPLHRAALSGDAALVRSLLAEGADAGRLEQTTHRTPLSLLLTPPTKARPMPKPNVEVVRALADRTESYKPDLRGYTPLILAARLGDAEVVKVLVKRSDVNAKEQSGKTALAQAIAAQSPEVVELLLRAGADPRCGTGNSAAAVENLAFRTPVGMTTKTTVARIAELLRKAGCEFSFPTAVATEQTDLVRPMLEANPSLANEMSKGDTVHQYPLALAAKNNDLETCRLLIASGADVSATDGGKQTALDHVIGATTGLAAIPTIEFLIDAGSPLGGDHPIMASAAATGNVELMKWLMAKEAGNADFAKDQLGQALVQICKPTQFAPTNAMRPEILAFLLSCGADVNCANNEWGRTALHYAAELPDDVAVEVAGKLLEAGARPDTRDLGGKTALERVPARNVKAKALLQRP